MKERKTPKDVCCKTLKLKFNLRNVDWIFSFLEKALSEVVKHQKDSKDERSEDWNCSEKSPVEMSSWKEIDCSWYVRSDVKKKQNYIEKQKFPQ
jgi:hypothetical protein